MLIAGAAWAGTLAELTWLQGHWQGTNGPSTFEEHWAAPLGPSMIGMFRMVSGGEVKFYELLVIEQEEAGPTMRIKHFSPRLVPWESPDEKVEMVATSFEPGRVRFEGQGASLVYVRDGDALTITLTKPGKDGAPRESVFAFKKTGAPR